jgi:23S rRNA pseudouridine2605 synthase
MTPKDKPKRGGAKPFARETKPRSADKPAFSAKAGFKPRKDGADKAGTEKAPRPRADRPVSVAMETSAKPERISKILARAGVASRRDIERMIMEGRVRLNGQVLETPVVNATMADAIEVDGMPIRGIERTRLWLYHKPAGLVTTNSDPEGRPTVFDNLPEGLPRVLSIGRLDINTEGLLLLTNDGGLSRVLELPTTGWLRRYRVRAYGDVKQEDLDKLKEGIAVDGVLYGSIEATLDRSQGHNVWITMGLREGKNREIKNVLGALGLEVNRLIRISYGPFQLGDLPESQVIEVRGRTLRDQLGPRLIEDSKANFDAPIYNDAAGDEAGETGARSERSAETRERSAWSPDKKRDDRHGGDFGRSENRRDDRRPGGKTAGKPAGGKSFGGRDRDERSFDDEEPKKRPPMGTSRTANVWMAPGARPTTDAQGKRTSARAEAEQLFKKPAPENDRRVVVNRVAGDSDWIRAENQDEGGRDDRRGGFGGKKSFGDRPDRGERSFDKPRGERSFGDKPRFDRKPREGGDRPRGDRPGRDGERSFGDRPRGERSFSDRPRGDRKPREEGDRPRGERSFSDRPARGDRPFSDRPQGERRPRADGDRPRGDRPAGDRPFGDKPRGKPFGGKPGGGKSFGGKPGGGKSFGGRPSGGGGKPGGGKPGGRPGSGGRPSGGKPRTPRG